MYFQDKKLNKMRKEALKISKNWYNEKYSFGIG